MIQSPLDRLLAMLELWRNSELRSVDYAAKPAGSDVLAVEETHGRSTVRSMGGMDSVPVQIR